MTENKYEIIAKIMAKNMFYGDWKWETPNERVITMLMEEVGLYKFTCEDEMIERTSVDEGLYKKATERVPCVSLENTRNTVTIEDNINNY